MRASPRHLADRPVLVVVGAEEDLAQLLLQVGAPLEKEVAAVVAVWTALLAPSLKVQSTIAQPEYPNEMMVGLNVTGYVTSPSVL